jgi:general secretion pathway protein G
MVIRSRCGFTLIELLVALAIVALLLSLVVPRYFGSVTRAEEAVLRENLYLVRDALDKHHADTGRWPGSLNELVVKKYLRTIPIDPITHSSDTWILIPPPETKEGALYDVRSGAPGVDSTGNPYVRW